MKNFKKSGSEVSKKEIRKIYDKLEGLEISYSTNEGYINQLLDEVSELKDHIKTLNTIHANWKNGDPTFHQATKKQIEVRSKNL